MDLRELFNTESRRMSTLLLGFAAAALAFGFHETSDWPWTFALLIAAGAGLTWAVSFLAGVSWAHAQLDAIRMNGWLSEAPRDHADRPRHKEAFDRANAKASLLYRAQQYGLIIGALLFATAHGVIIHEKNGAKTTGEALSAKVGCRPQGEGSVYAPKIRASQPPRDGGASGGS